MAQGCTFTLLLHDNAGTHLAIKTQNLLGQFGWNVGAPRVQSRSRPQHLFLELKKYLTGQHFIDDIQLYLTGQHFIDDIELITFVNSFL